MTRIISTTVTVDVEVDFWEIFDSLYVRDQEAIVQELIADRNDERISTAIYRLRMGYDTEKTALEILEGLL